MKKNIAIVLLLVITLCLAFPANAFAYTNIKTHSWKTKIDATINTDGSILVSENRIVDITKFVERAKKYKATDQQQNTQENLNPLIWSFNSFPEEADVTANDAKVAILSNTDTVMGNWKNLPSTTFLSKWHNDSSPKQNCITYDAEYKELCLFDEIFNADQLTEKRAADIMTTMTGITDPNGWTTTKAIIKLDYSINEAPIVYKDVSDFKWTYVSDTWKEDSYNVELNVTIPVGPQSIASPLGKVSNKNNEATERNIYAWGHGSSTGIVNLDPNGSVNLKNDIVPGDTNAEIRIVFPSAWLTNLDNKANTTHSNQTKLTQILKEESVWHDQRQNEVNKLLVPLIYIPICIIILIITLIEFIKYKRRFKEQAVSNTKVQDLNPCLIVRLKNWNHEHTYDIVASVLHLNDQGKLRIKRLPSNDFKLELKNPNFAVNPYKARSIDDLDKRTISFLFGVCATKTAQITLDNLLNFARTRSKDFMVAYLSWHSNLSDQVNQLTNFKSNYDKIRHILFGCAIALPIIAIILGIFLHDLITPAAGIFSGVVIGFIANTMRNKIYFKDSKDHVINAVDIPIGLKEYNETIAEFKDKMAETLAEAVLSAQDKLC